MNDSPKKVARHSLLAINCRKTKGIRTVCGIVWRLANFVTQPEVELNMGKVNSEKARGWLFLYYFLILYYIYKNIYLFGFNGAFFFIT